MWPVDWSVMQYTHNLYHRLPPPATTGSGEMEESRGAGALAAFLRPYHGTCLRVSVTSEHRGGGGVCSGADGRDTELVGMSRNPSECCPTACDDECQMVTKVLGTDGWAGYVTCRSSVSATVRTQALKSGRSTSACGQGAPGQKVSPGQLKPLPGTVPWEALVSGWAAGGVLSGSSFS